MPDEKTYPLPNTLCDFDALRPTRLADVQRILDADKELMRIARVSPVTESFREFIRSLRVKVFTAPHLLDGLDTKASSRELTKIVKTSSAESADQSYPSMDDALIPEPQVRESMANIPDPGLFETDDTESVGSHQQSFPKDFYPASPIGNSWRDDPAYQVSYSPGDPKQYAVAVRKHHDSPTKSIKSLDTESDRSVSLVGDLSTEFEEKKTNAKKKAKPKKGKKMEVKAQSVENDPLSSSFGVAVSAKESVPDTPSLVQKRLDTLKALARKGVHVISSADPQPERITETCPKHNRCVTYEVIRKKYAIEVYDVKQVEDE